MKKFIGSVKLLFLGFFAGINLLAISGCKSSNQIVYGNYESYMSSDLMDKVSRDYDVEFDYYGTDGNLAAGLRNNIFDIATASTNTLKELKAGGYISPIDWSAFKDENGQPLITYPEDIGLHHAGDQITNVDDIAKNLFIEPVQKILGTGENNLLNWGIPYFLQSFIFVYWGDNNLKVPASSLTWEGILNWIKNNYQYFNNGNLTSVEERRTLFSLANIIYSQKENKIDPKISASVNPKKLGGISYETLSDEYNEIFASFTDILNRQTMHSNGNVLFLNSDSYVSVNKIASKQAHGGFMFNGDALYTAEGGELHEDNPPTPGIDFFVAVPSVTPLALDMIVINKKSPERKKANIYKTIYKIGLDGCNDTISDYKNYQKAVETYGAIENFDYVKYISPLNSINNYINQHDPKDEKTYTGYFTQVVKEHPAWKALDEQTISKALLSIYNAIPPWPDGDITNFVEAPLSDEGKSALEFSFLQFKNNL